MCLWIEIIVIIQHKFIKSEHFKMQQIECLEFRVAYNAIHKKIG